jgi:transposase
MPKKIDPAVRERAVRLVREHRAEYSSLTAAAEAVARRERLGKETVRPVGPCEPRLTPVSARG